MSPTPDRTARHHRIAVVSDVHGNVTAYEAVLADIERRGITHVYVDWSEIERHRKPGGYGFTDFVTPGLLARLVAEGILEPVERLGAQQELYRVR